MSGIARIAPAGMPEVASSNPANPANPASKPPGLLSEEDQTKVDAAKKALQDEKDENGNKNSSKLANLANQLLTASQQKPTFSPMQLQPMNTGPFRPLPINLPPNFGTGR